MDATVDLYALTPEDFTAARDRAAKQADPAHRTELKALRRPSVAAWVVNSLVRHEPDLLVQLLDVGRELAEAQHDGQGAALRELSEQRRQLVDAVTEQAVALVDRAVSAAVRAEVAGTLDAALVDPASGEAVASGQLVRALSFAGFGGVDLDGAVAPLPRPTPAEPENDRESELRATRAEVAAAEQRTHASAGVLDDTVRRLRGTREAWAAAREQERSRSAAQEQTGQHLEQARAALLAAEEAVHDAEQAHVTAQEQAARREREVGAAEAAVEQAQQQAEQARAHLDRLRRR